MIDPKATPLDLERLASERSNWDLLPAMREHPSCWPELAAWIEEAQAHPDTAGAPPEPPAPEHVSVFERLCALTPHRTHAPVIDGAPRATEAAHDDFEESKENKPPESDSSGDMATMPIPRKRRLPRISRKALITVPAAALIVLASLGAATLWSSHDRQAALQREQTITREYEKASAAGRKLLDETEVAPMSEDEKVLDARKDLTAALESTSGPRASRADAISTESSTLRKAWAEATETAISDTTTKLKDSIAKAERLSDAPDTTAKKQLLDLTAKWKSTSIDADNLQKALDARDAIESLAATVTTEKSDAVQKKKEAEKQKATTPNSTPSQKTQGTTPVTPRRQSNANSTPAPSQQYKSPRSGSAPQKTWNVPDTVTEGSLPEHL